jgi:hypothetical protein
LLGSAAKGEIRRIECSMSTVIKNGVIIMVGHAFKGAVAVVEMAGIVE